MTSTEIQQEIERTRERIPATMSAARRCQERLTLATLETAYQTSLLNEQLAQVRLTPNGAVRVSSIHGG